MRGVNKDREEENNVSRDLPRGKLNLIYIPKNSYRHHVYMDNGVYDKWSTWDIIYSFFVHRCVPGFNDIPLLDENFSKWRFINWLLDLESYFYFNKISYYKKVGLVTHKLSYGAK